MATSKRVNAPRPEVLETGNVLFFYRPTRPSGHPRSSDDVAHVYLALYPDDQSVHDNRLIAFAEGVFPPVIPEEELPEEREWAVVLETSPSPLGLIGAIENLNQPPSSLGQVPPPARVAGRGRYVVVRRDERTYFAYGVAEPNQLGPVQQMLLMEQQAFYQVRVSEPFASTGIVEPGPPKYPDSLGNKFVGRMTIPVDPTDFLDYRGSRLYFVAVSTDVFGELGVRIDALAENAPVQDALLLLADVARRELPEHPKELLKPMESGEIV